MAVDEESFVRLLNSAPVVEGRITETLDDPVLRGLRDDLHRVIRGESSSRILSPYLDGVSQTPTLLGPHAGIDWKVVGPADALPLAEFVLEWSRIETELPGRLRPCANPDCNKFLIDHSKPNTARWCSMATCGNRMKARRFHSRHTAAASAGSSPSSSTQRSRG